jgi:hypothetical protein
MIRKTFSCSTPNAERVLVIGKISCQDTILVIKKLAGGGARLRQGEHIKVSYL